MSNTLDEKTIDTLVSIFGITDIRDVRASILGSIVFRTQDVYLNYTNIFVYSECPYVIALKNIDYSLIGEQILAQIIQRITDIIGSEFKNITDDAKKQMAISIEILNYLYIYSKTNQQIVEKEDAVKFINKYFDDFYTKGNFEEFNKLDSASRIKFKNTLTGYNNFYQIIKNIRDNLEPINARQQLDFLAEIPKIYELFQQNSMLPIYSTTSGGSTQPVATGDKKQDKTSLIYTIITAVLLFILLVLGLYVLYKKEVRVVFIFLFVVGVFGLTFLLLSQLNKPESGEPYDFIRPKNPAPEVFLIEKKTGRVASDQAEQICKIFGADVASAENLNDAQKLGADWCSSGWTKESDGSLNGYYPINFQTRQGCGNGKTGVVKWTPPDNKANVNCVGIKPDPKDKDEYKDYNIYPSNCIRYRQLPNPFILPNP
jgi:hypothetical protein